jgi:flagellar assembly protein FliH
MPVHGRSLSEIDNIRKELLQQGRGEIVNLIITLKKVIAQELTTPRNIIAATLENALEQAIASEEFYVSLHPDDLAFAEEKAPEIIAAIRGLDRIVFEDGQQHYQGRLPGGIKGLPGGRDH